MQIDSERGRRIGSAFWAFIAGFILAIFLATMARSEEVPGVRWVFLTVMLVAAVVNVFRQIFQPNGPPVVPHPVIYKKGEDGVARNEFGEPI